MVIIELDDGEQGVGTAVLSEVCTGHDGPEAEKRYSSTLSLISTLDSGGW